MAHEPELQQRLLELIYGLLCEEEAAGLRHRIATEQDVARAMAEAEQTAALWKRAARVESTRIPLVRPIGPSPSRQGVVAPHPTPFSQAAAPAPSPDAPKSPDLPPPERSSVRPASRHSLSAATARAGWRRWSQWTVGLAAGILLLVSLGGYAYYRGELSELAAEHVRLRVTGPARLQLAGPNRFDIATTDLAGNPLATQVQFTLVGREGHALLSHQEPTGPAGLLQVALPRDIKADSSVKLQIAASYGALSERFETPLPVVPETLVTYVASDRPVYAPGQTVRCRSLTLSAIDRSVDRECSVRFSLLDANGRSVAGTTSTESATRGVATAKVVLPSGLEPGAYALAAASPEGAFATSQVPIQIEPLQRPSLLADVEFLRDNYAAGGKVVAHLMARRPDGSPVAGVKFQAVAEVDGKDAYRTAGETSRAGAHQLAFALPRQVAKADARLTITLDDAGRKIQTARRLPLEQPKVAVAFFPEGGGLVAGLPSRVYFTARDARGSPVSMSGQVVDSQGRAVALIETNRNGMGTFLFEPAADEPYRVRIERPVGVGDTPKLPPTDAGRAVALNAGLAVYEPGKPIEFNVRSAEENLPLVAAIACHNVLVGQQAFLGHRKASGVVVGLDDDVAGVLRLTLYDYRSSPPKPIAERWVFRRPSRWLTVRCTQTEPRDAAGRTDVAVEVADEQNRPVEATLAAAVAGDPAAAFTPSLWETSFHDASMPAHFLPAGAVGSGADLDNARFYLSDDPQAAASLDLFLGTREARRFTETAAMPATQPLATLAAGLSPPLMFDNLSELQARYRENMLAWNAHRARMLNLVITVSLFGAIGLVVYLALLALMNIPTGPRLWVPSLGVASVCLLLGIFLLNPQRHRAGGDEAIAFAGYQPGVKTLAVVLHELADGEPAKDAPAKDAAAESIRKTTAGGKNGDVPEASDALTQELLNPAESSEKTRRRRQKQLEEKVSITDHAKREEATGLLREREAWDVLEPTKPQSGHSAPGKALAEKKPPSPMSDNKPAAGSPWGRATQGVEQGVEGVPAKRSAATELLRSGGIAAFKTPAPAAPKASAPMPPADASTLAAPKAAPTATPKASATTAPAPAPSVSESPMGMTGMKGVTVQPGYGVAPKAGVMPGGGLGASLPASFPGGPMPSPMRGGMSGMSGAGGMPGMSGGGAMSAVGGMPGMGGGYGALQQKKDDRKPSDVTVMGKGDDSGVAGQPDRPTAFGKPMQPAEPAGRAYPLAEMPMRADNDGDSRNAPALLYWNPAFQTDAQGRGRIAFGVPSNDAAYRVTIDAHTADGRLGRAVHAWPASPPSALASRHPALQPSPLGARDRSGAVDADAKRKLAPAQRKEDFHAAASDRSAGIVGVESRGRLLPNLWGFADARSVDSAAKFDRFDAKDEFRLKAGEAGEPAPGYVRTQVSGGRTDHAAEFRWIAPADAAPGTLRASVIVEPSTIATSLRALDALLEEPDESFENAVARMHLASLTLQAMVERGAAQPALVRQLKAVLHHAYVQAVKRECPEQGFQWFGKGRGDATLTGLGLAAFAQTATWYDVDASRTARNVRWLARRVEVDVAGAGGKPAGAIVSKPVATASGRHAGRDVAAADQAGDIEAQWNRMASRLVASAGPTPGGTPGDPTADAPRLGLAALAALETDRQADSRDLLGRLVALQADDGSLRGDAGLFARPGSDSARIERTALALAGWSRLPEFAAPARRAADWLLRHRLASGLFGPPMATALAVRGLVQLDQGSPAVAGDRTVQVNQGEIVAAARPISADALMPVLIADLGSHVGAGESRWVIRAGGGTIAYQAVLSWQTAKPDDDPRCPLRLGLALGDAKIRAGQAVDLAVELSNATEQALPATVVRIGLPPGLEPSGEQLNGLASVGTVDAGGQRGGQLWFYRQGVAAKEKLAWRVQLRAGAPATPGKHAGEPSAAFLYDTPEQRRWAAPLAVEIAP